MAIDTVKALADLPGKVWGVAKAIVGVQERDPDSPVSIVGGSRISRRDRLQRPARGHREARLLRLA